MQTRKVKITTRKNLGWALNRNAKRNVKIFGLNTRKREVETNLDSTFKIKAYQNIS